MTNFQMTTVGSSGNKKPSSEGDHIDTAQTDRAPYSRAKSRQRPQRPGRLRQLEAGQHGLATLSKVDVVYLALQLFLVARIAFAPSVAS